MFRYASRKYRHQIAKDIRPVYPAPTEAAKDRFVEFAAKMGTQYPAVLRLWENARSQFVAFLDYDVKVGSTFNRTAPGRCRNAGHRRRC